MTDETPARDQDKFVLRLPSGMRDRIARAAKGNGRSMNAEIVQLLEMYYPPDPPADEIAELISGIMRMNKGVPPREKWGDLYSWLMEFHARLLREAATNKLNAEAAPSPPRRKSDP